MGKYSMYMMERTEYLWWTIGKDKPPRQTESDHESGAQIVYSDITITITKKLTMPDIGLYYAKESFFQRKYSEQLLRYSPVVAKI